MNRLKEIGEEPTEHFRYFSYGFFVEMTSFFSAKKVKIYRQDSCFTLHISYHKKEHLVSVLLVKISFRFKKRVRRNGSFTFVRLFNFTLKNTAS